MQESYSLGEKRKLLKLLLEELGEQVLVMYTWRTCLYEECADIVGEVLPRSGRLKSRFRGSLARGRKVYQSGSPKLLERS
ncbi:hypothetical protein F2Q70_00027427 [Brassica cretica]|uniref:Uncharacterized protein n=1 Tax=Brassica cretica TaxID=69181 RepID=A0A8S9L1Q4_BRACR|nr:hypothetical protein F2Q70_00027427 [Brassica cretica]